MMRTERLMVIIERNFGCGASRGETTIVSSADSGMYASTIDHFVCYVKVNIPDQTNVYTVNHLITNDLKVFLYKISNSLSNNSSCFSAEDTTSRT
jgi:hypothetical protein